MVAPDNPVLGRRWRGRSVETIHRGCWAIVDNDGQLLAGAGQAEQPVFARSSSKSMQALALVDSGALDQFGVTPDEFAVTLSSHSGEAVHVAAVRSLLARAGLDESSLRCGASTPWFDPTGESLRIHHCCSGKHAGFLAAAMARGEDPADYLDPSAPLQRRVHELLAEITGVDPADLMTEIDGCSAPTFVAPLRALAQAMARITNPADLSAPIRKGCERMVEAAAAHPAMVGGTRRSRFDSAIIEVTGGRLFSKEGAEGVLLVGVAGAGVAFAGKIDDGSLRALWPLAVEVLARFGHIGDDERAQLMPWIDPVIRNADRLEVGHLELASLDHP